MVVVDPLIVVVVRQGQAWLMAEKRDGNKQWKHRGLGFSLVDTAKKGIILVSIMKDRDIVLPCLPTLLLYHHPYPSNEGLGDWEREW